MFARDLRHAARGGVKVWIDPRIRFFQPHFPVTFVPPTGRRWSDHLVCRIFREVTRRGGELEIVLVVGGFSQKTIQPFRPLKPPMSKEFCIKRAKYHWSHVHVFPQLGELRTAGFQKVRRMMIRRAQRPIPLVKFLVAGVARDAVVLQPSEAALLISKKRLQIFDRRIVTNVSVKIPIRRIPWVAFLCAPDLSAGVAVSPECGRSRRSETRRINGVSWARTAKHQAV